MESVVRIQPLYGGAMMSSIFNQFDDISSIRQVPDHQEVFVDRISDSSIIVELFDKESSLTSNEEAIIHYFNDLAAFNESIKSNMIFCGTVSESNNMSSFNIAPMIDNIFPKVVLVGKQCAAKFKTNENSTYEDFYIFLVLIRLTNVSTDVLISMNVPLSASHETSFDPVVFETGLHLNLFCPDYVVDNQTNGTYFYKMIDALKLFVNSLQIIDWNLFG